MKKLTAEIQAPVIAARRRHPAHRLLPSVVERKGMERYITPFIVVPMVPVVFWDPFMIACWLYAFSNMPKVIAKPTHGQLIHAMKHVLPCDYPISAIVIFHSLEESAPSDFSFLGAAVLTGRRACPRTQSVYPLKFDFKVTV